jgi:all-trans-nonaprenyl-diphosphate synthase
VDDILDFTQTAEQLGKPQGQDLASGNLTAPVIYALQQSKELEEIIQSEYESFACEWVRGCKQTVCSTV